MYEDSGIPIVQIGNALLVSIQMTLHDELLENLSAALADRLRVSSAGAVAIDLSSVGLIDSFTTRIINRIAAMARLMGVRTVISGIQPDVAMTMVEMGIALEGVETFLSIDQALARIGLRMGASDLGDEHDEADEADADDEEHRTARGHDLDLWDLV
jgi:rsbT antagonist protein RsbS